MKTKDVLTIIAFIIMVTGFVSLFFYQKNNSKNLEKNGLRTVGKIDVIGQDVVCTYTVKDQAYSKRVTSPYYGLVSGESYIIAYDSLDNDNFQIIYSLPVLSKEYQYNNTKTENISTSFEDNEVVKYTFIVGNNKYERLQQIGEDKKSFNKQNTFLVKYNIINPQMAYVYLDSIVSGK